MIMVIIHSVFGITALISGSANLIINAYRKKNMHKILGYTFVFSSIVTSLFGLALSIEKNIPLLTSIAIFTMLQLFSGIISIHNKKYNPRIYEDIICILYIMSFIYIFNQNTIESLGIGVIYFIVFLFYFYNLYIKKNKEKTLYISQHIENTIGVLISMITSLFIGAFGASFIFWIIPSLIFIPIIRHYRVKYAPINTMIKKGIKLW